LTHFATCFKHIIPSNGEGLQLLPNYCLLVDSVSNMFHAVIGYLFSFVAICLLNFPVTELLTNLVICLLLNLLNLYFWARFHIFILFFEVLDLVEHLATRCYCTVRRFEALAWH
jgi:hypothetical protein